jgi:hypothetical protein
MASLVTLVAGTTGAVYFQLLDQGLPLDLTDFSISLLLTAADGSIIPSPTVSIVNAPNGLVSYTPASTDLSSALSPYRARWKLSEDSGTVNYIPGAYRDEWDVTAA